MTAQTVISDGNLPSEPNSFIGRQRDLAELARLLGDVRAVTLCGPGGIGKTRLAVRLACEVAPGFPDGAWLAELADTAEETLVLPRVAAVLGVREEPGRPLAETVVEALRPRRLLLILDTCEHVVNACAALVKQLLAGCPGLRVIATSREPLRVRGETVWRVPPLELPGRADELSAVDLGQHEAIRLFAERAAAARPGFALAGDSPAAVYRLCRTLDGIPLAIELAAARVGALSVEQIAARVGDRFQLLATGDRTAPPRQQTLRAAVDWSHDLLTEPEQVLLRRLAVFSGWNLEMAEQVCADERIPARRVLDLLAALIDKSLVTVDGEVDGDTRYRLLDTIREYASDRLNASGEGEAMRLRHRDYLLGLAEYVNDQVFVRGDPPWPERVSFYRRGWTESANCRAALTYCLDHGDAEEGLRLCWTLRSLWVVYGDVAEAVGWLDRCLALGGDVPALVRGRALTLRAEVAFEQQDYRAARRYAQAGMDLFDALGAAGAVGLARAQRALTLVAVRASCLAEALARIDSSVENARAGGDAWEEGLALSIKASIIARQGKPEEAEQTFSCALDLLWDNNRWGVAQVLYGLGGLARGRGDQPAALEHFRDALAIYREIDARPEMARVLAGIGWVALAQGDLALASASLAESLQLSLATGQRLSIARGLEASAQLAAINGDPDRAVRLAGAAIALREAVAHEPGADARSRLDGLLQLARGRAGPDVAAGLLGEGAAMNAHEAVSLALSIPAATTHPGQAAAGSDPGAESALTARELEIAALIARGLSNRGIADELVISPATAARHVANIFSKLGFTSRAQVAAWAAQLEQRAR
jgi:predicted ATPase/DNA-binding CsgD family transcriptional regulator/Tfp pilus assembly protein PilF